MRPRSELKSSFPLEAPRAPAMAIAKPERPPSISTPNGRRSISITPTACSAHRWIPLNTVSQSRQGRKTVAHCGSGGGKDCDGIEPRRADTVAHSFSRNHVHLVFSTKDRRNSIAKEWQPRLWASLAGICKNHEMIALSIGGMENHVHILLHLSPKLALAKAVLLLKAHSSKWMAERAKDFS